MQGLPSSVQVRPDRSEAGAVGVAVVGALGPALARVDVRGLAHAVGGAGVRAMQTSPSVTACPPGPGRCSRRPARCTSRCSRRRRPLPDRVWCRRRRTHPGRCSDRRPSRRRRRCRPSAPAGAGRSRCSSTTSGGAVVTGLAVVEHAVAADAGVRSPHQHVAAVLARDEHAPRGIDGQPACAFQRVSPSWMISCAA